MKTISDQKRKQQFRGAKRTPKKKIEDHQEKWQFLVRHFIFRGDAGFDKASKAMRPSPNTNKIQDHRQLSKDAAIRGGLWS
jgi:hypothetical protein